MSQLNSILEAVATIQKTITFTAGSTSGSITDAYAYNVADTLSANTPFFYNVIKGGPIDYRASLRQRVTNDIDMYLCEARFDSDATLQRLAERVAYWRDAVIEAFAAHIRLGGALSFVNEAYLVSYEGFQSVTIGSTEWAAMLFRMKVIEFYQVTVSA